MQGRSAWLTLFWFAMSASASWGGDWPQILGPQRSGIADSDEHLLQRWPKGGPPTLWERKVGHGYAGLAVAGNRGILFHRIDDEEIVEGIDVATGRTLFQDKSPTSFAPQVGGRDGDGPLCVPTIHQGRVISYGAQGILTCLDLETGRRLWQHKTHREFNAQEGYFGAGSSPIVVDQAVVVNVGGRNGAGIVAFDLETGAVLWKQTDEPASYSAPVQVNINDMPLVLMVTRYQCVLIDPKSGTLLFQFPFGQRGPTVNGASPVVMGDRLLVTSSYGIGGVYAEFDLFGTRPIWKGEKPVATQYCTPIPIDGFLYLINGRDDVPPADFECIELAALRSRVREGDQPSPGGAAPITTSPQKWIEHNFGYGTLILADGRLLAQKTDGELLLINPNPEALKVVSRCQSLRGVTRALPALSNGRYFLRNEDTLKCLHLARGL
ncbi:outer membrane protein assembly factor BamB family protein [Planctomicrobium piriforme]|uniref:Outer membrane protein assembly factor BamB, contains PQQ-like beta-propeller repeat n=1 Tax=Planctomicrobium piriforme TaxID=1576369 RepID=A0A1I3F311_9PLAN|nr:PQQ-binding-like beta-propeller repeat protein [Planctomicrobium piriforme]SFI05655.1 Outer membrane protein assembly factor BamB, contains PQQ-like beta-propeller repeat [Planctomicrobium piriforme]